MRNARSKVPRRPVILIILDGFGSNPAKANNAIALAETPNLDRYFSSHPPCALLASGASVVLPDRQMDNSEVGHMTMGSGCVVRQDLVLINDAIADRSFYREPELLDAVRSAAASGRPTQSYGLGVGRRRPQPCPAPGGPDQAVQARGGNPHGAHVYRWP